MKTKRRMTYRHADHCWMTEEGTIVVYTPSFGWLEYDPGVWEGVKAEAAENRSLAQTEDFIWAIQGRGPEWIYDAR